MRFCKQFWEGLSDYLQSECPIVPNFEVRPVWAIRLPSSIRHIGIETRFGLRNSVIGIDLWFWRQESIPVWNKIHSTPEAYSTVIGEEWKFEQSKDRPRGRIYIELPMEHLRDASSWPPAYEWFGSKLALIYEKLFPVLRVEMEKISTKA